MILKASIVGMLVILIVVLTISYYINQEGFISQMTASQAIGTSGGMVFTCSTGDIRGGNGVGPYRLSTVNGVSTISVATGSTATVSISNCQAFKLGANTAADVMMVSGSAATNPPTTSATTASAAATNPPTTSATTASTAATTAATSSSTATRPAGTVTGIPMGSATGASNLGSSLTSATSTAVPQTTQSAAKPKRTDIKADIDVSKTAQKAMYLKQQSDFLKDLQIMIRNELRSARAMDSSTVESNDSCDETSAISQGKEYASNTIKKDAIPCWGCSLDY